MGKAQTKIVIVLAVVAVVVAVVMVRQQGKRPEEGFETRKVFDGVAIGEVTRVAISDGAETITLRKLSNKEWGLASRGDYPVDNERLRRLVLSILSLEAIDRLTSNADKYEKLGVADDAESGRVQLYDGKDQLLAGLYLGKQRQTKNPQQGFAAPAGQFVRADGDPAVYVSSEVLSVEKQPNQWLHRDLVNVGADELLRIEIEHSESAEGFAQSRSSPEGAFELETAIPDGQKLQSGVLGNVSQALANLTLEDVLVADSPEAQVIEFESTYRAMANNGMVYQVDAGERDEKHYVRLSAEVGDVPEPAAEGQDGDGKNEDEPAPVAKETPPVEEQVKALNARHRAWVYEIRKYAYDNLAKKRSELLEEIKPEAEKEGGGG